jgi:inosine/xanthosine triphosphatase
MTSFIIGSQNPVELQAVRQGAAALLGEITVTSIDVPSDVRAQPIGDDEMIAGATNRANAALRTHSTATFGVGLEGGVTDRAQSLFASAWCAVAHHDGRVGLAHTGQFMLSPTRPRPVLRVCGDDGLDSLCKRRLVCSKALNLTPQTPQSPARC